MTTKVQRQGAVAQLIADHDVTSHTQLVSLLKKAGIVATQATVSRDLEEIGAVKVRTSHGETAYAIPEFEPDRIAPLEQLHPQRFLQQAHLTADRTVGDVEAFGGAHEAFNLRSGVEVAKGREGGQLHMCEKN